MIHGTCGNCGGAVISEYEWAGYPKWNYFCQQCKVIPRDAYGPVIPMQEKKDK